MLPEKLRYRYEVRRTRGSWSVIAVGPKGGARWIVTYASQQIADHVAFLLNENEGS